MLNYGQIGYDTCCVSVLFPALTLHFHVLQLHLQFVLERRENLLSGCAHSSAQGFKKLLKFSVATMSKGQNMKCSRLFLQPRWDSEKVNTAVLLKRVLIKRPWPHLIRM